MEQERRSVPDPPPESDPLENHCAAAHAETARPTESSGGDGVPSRVRPARHPAGTTPTIQATNKKNTCKMCTFKAPPKKNIQPMDSWNIVTAGTLCSFCGKTTKTLQSTEVEYSLRHRGETLANALIKRVGSKNKHAKSLKKQWKVEKKFLKQHGGRKGHGPRAKRKGGESTGAKKAVAVKSLSDKSLLYHIRETKACSERFEHVNHMETTSVGTLMTTALKALIAKDPELADGVC